MVITGEKIFKFLMLGSILMQSLFLLGYFFGSFPNLNIGLSLIFIGSSLTLYLGIAKMKETFKKNT